MVRKRQTEREEAAMAQELRHSVHRTVVSATQHAALADKMQKWEKEKHQKREQKQRQRNISLQRVHKRKVSAETVVNRLYVKPASSDKSEPVVRPAWGDGLRPETNKPHLTHGGAKGGSGGFHFTPRTDHNLRRFRKVEEFPMQFIHTTHSTAINRGANVQLGDR